MLKSFCLILWAILLICFSSFDTLASSSRNCIFKAKIVDIEKTIEKTKKIHPDITFGGVCYASDVYFAQIEKIEMNNSVYFSTSKQDLTYCQGLIDLLSSETYLRENRPIGIKLCVDKNQELPKVDDIVDIRYNWSMGRTDSKASVSWEYISLNIDRESRKKLMAKQCEAGDGSICIQLGQMYWQDRDENGEVESYRKACKIDKGNCTYYKNALTRTGREK